MGREITLEEFSSLIEALKKEYLDTKTRCENKQKELDENYFNSLEQKNSLDESKSIFRNYGIESEILTKEIEKARQITIQKTAQTQSLNIKE